MDLQEEGEGEHSKKIHRYVNCSILLYWILHECMHVVCNSQSGLETLSPLYGTIFHLPHTTYAFLIVLIACKHKLHTAIIH